MSQGMPGGAPPGNPMGAWAAKQAQSAGAPQKAFDDDPGPNAKCPHCGQPITLTVLDAAPKPPPPAGPPAGGPPAPKPAGPPMGGGGPPKM